ncbi:uncharacterized protein PHALS_14978 [Plasmopara halstedii]|uniref:Uncharacterized protein n=1 Tax=Plasmopara halstedii TaxID=4781 RepID=A0A0P1A8R0_PLAHL|nr:uncharacterized protein PHALS_14978 [Plasmopara halstedii]CEG36737.1 hypothetical protein PHALS_14978 [Plasmopara halstedii]|eukprot:XP_024573106.1 hypothetical protein PHALS_14978 [Plasmopara halstedii]
MDIAVSTLNWIVVSTISCMIMYFRQLKPWIELWKKASHYETTHYVTLIAGDCDVSLKAHV